MKITALCCAAFVATASAFTATPVRRNDRCGALPGMAMTVVRIGRGILINFRSFRSFVVIVVVP
jgi:hypothetical protein